MRALVLTIIVAVRAAVSPWGTPAAAQDRAATDRSVDRIVAVVGTRPILAAQVEEQLVLAQSQGQKVPEDSAGGAAPRGQGPSPVGGGGRLGGRGGGGTTIKGSGQGRQEAGG